MITNDEYVSVRMCKEISRSTEVSSRDYPNILLERLRKVKALNKLGA
jgi:hypothetical protein